MNHYTLFVDRSDGTGFYRGYKHLRSALKAYRQHAERVGIDRAWVCEYADDDRDYSRMVVDWNRERPHTSGRIRASDLKESGASTS